MHDSRVPPLAITLLLASAAFLVACASAPAPAVFEGLEQRWLAALQAHDAAALDELLDDSFLDSSFRGALRTKADVLGGPPVAGPYHTLRLDDLQVRTYGRATAIVTGVNVLRGASRDDIARVRFTDVFVLRGGHWRAVAAQETLESASPH